VRKFVRTTAMSMGAVRKILDLSSIAFYWSFQIFI